MKQMLDSFITHQRSAGRLVRPLDCIARLYSSISLGRRNSDCLCPVLGTILEFNSGTLERTTTLSRSSIFAHKRTGHVINRPCIILRTFYIGVFGQERFCYLSSQNQLPQNYISLTNLNRRFQGRHIVNVDVVLRVLAG